MTARGNGNPYKNSRAGSAGRGRGRRCATTLAALSAAAVLLSGCGPTASAIDPRVPAQTSAPTSSAQAPAGLPRSIPERITIPKIGADSSLVALGLQSDGTLAVPPLDKPMQAAWYDKSPTPGEVGPSVVLGHVDGDHMEGIFYELKMLAPGDEIDIARADGKTVKFRVTKMDSVSKDSFPTDAVYGNTPDPELRLITCGGSLDRAAHSYRNNIIVYANLI